MDNLSSYLLPTFYTGLTHPFTHARTLMQLGFEPAPPYLGNSLSSALGFGKKCYKYPSIITYWSSLRQDIGMWRLFTTGLPARIIIWHLSTATSDLVLQSTSDNPKETDKYLNSEVDVYPYVVEVAKLTLARTSAVIVSYPFHVFMVRQMAEILNEGPVNSKYLITMALEIFDEEGIGGFFGGLSARLVGEVATIWITASFVYGFNRYVLKERVGDDIKEYTPTLGGLLASSFTYKFSVMSSVMSISGSKISGALKFTSLFDCFSYLRGKHALKRGSAFFMRYVD